MRNVSSKSRSNGVSSFDSPDGYSCDIDPKYIINIANNYTNLKIHLDNYNIQLYEVPSQKGWNFRCICPFKFHRGGNERTASFGYNAKEDRFHCFGCKSSGRSVEFLALFEGRKFLEVAKDILFHADIDYQTELELIHSNHDEDIQCLIVEFSKYLYELRQKHPNYLNQLERIIYCFDMYLGSTVASSRFNLEELKLRIEYYKERLSEIFNIR